MDTTQTRERSRRRSLLIANRHARRGARRSTRPGSCRRRRDVDKHAHSSGARDRRAIRAAAGSYDCVIVGGGDGTLHAAAPALIETGLTLGILPLGTANDLARTLGIDQDPVAAARTIADGYAREVDLGEVNGHPYWNVASVGLSVELAGELTAETKRRWGKRATPGPPCACSGAGPVPRGIEPRADRAVRRAGGGGQRPALRWRHDGRGQRQAGRRTPARLASRSHWCSC